MGLGNSRETGELLIEPSVLLAPRNNSRYIRVKVSSELYNQIDKICKEKGISKNLLLKILLVLVVKRKIDIDVEKQIKVKYT